MRDIATLSSTSLPSSSSNKPQAPQGRAADVGGQLPGPPLGPVASEPLEHVAGGQAGDVGLSAGGADAGAVEVGQKDSAGEVGVVSGLAGGEAEGPAADDVTQARRVPGGDGGVRLRLERRAQGVAAVRGQQGADDPAGSRRRHAVGVDPLQAVLRVPSHFMF
ncbi:hypothetical protein VUR80DRAFT_636 [Thermomyces stellatus]